MLHVQAGVGADPRVTYAKHLLVPILSPGQPRALCDGLVLGERDTGWPREQVAARDGSGEREEENGPFHED